MISTATGEPTHQKHDRWRLTRGVLLFEIAELQLALRRLLIMTWHCISVLQCTDGLMACQRYTSYADV